MTQPAPPPAPQPSPSRAVAPEGGHPAEGRIGRAASALVGLLVLLAWLPMLDAPLFWDDRGTFTDNAFLDAPWASFVAESLRPHLGHWQPATWWSLRLDGLLFAPWLAGGAAAAHMLGNLLLHALTAALLCGLLWRLTDRGEGPGLRRALASVGPTLVWALHPCRVESVGWRTERRDVLAALLVLLGLRAWLRASRSLDAAASARWRRAAWAWFAVSALAKAWVVALPAVLVGLSLWRGAAGGASGRARERWRAALVAGAQGLLLAVPVALVALWAQRHAGATAAASGYGLLERLVGAGHGLWRYLGLTLWPQHLSPLHPIVPGTTLDAAHVGATLALVALTVALVWRALEPAIRADVARRPRAEAALGIVLMSAGWLAPVLGLAQSGVQAVAERYLHLPHLMLALPLALLLSDGLPRRGPGRSPSALPVAALLALALVPLGLRLQGWQATWIAGGEALWSAAIAAEPRSPHALANRAALRRARGDRSGARADLDAALSHSPSFANALEQRAGLRADAGDLRGALVDLNLAVLSAPTNAKVRCNRAALRARAGALKGAAEDFDAGVAAGAGPDCVLNRAVLRVQTGDPQGALADVRSALSRLPRSHPLRARAEGMARALASRAPRVP